MSYGWTDYDARIGGSQVFHDEALHVDLETDFYKTTDGESWTLRVTGTPRDDAPDDVKTAIIFNLALEKAQNVTERRGLLCYHDPMNQGQGATRPAVSCAGKVPGLGDVDAYVIWDSRSVVADGPAVKSLNVSEDKIWQAKGKLSTDCPFNLGCTTRTDNCSCIHQGSKGLGRRRTAHGWMEPWEHALLTDCIPREILSKTRPSQRPLLPS